MRAAATVSFVALLSSVVTAEIFYSPFSDPLFGRSDEELLVKRQTGCQAGYNSCGAQGDSGACCPDGSRCTQDVAGNVACCPTSALCTGTRSGGGTNSGLNTGTDSTGGVILSTSTTAAPNTITTISSLTAALPSTGVAGGGSTVPNNFYPFVYIPTSYNNGDLCRSAYFYCQSQSTACAASLGGSNGVTVSGFGGGITVQGASATTLNPASASSICSSLSQQACYGISEAQCGPAPTGAAASTATNTATFIQNPNIGPRQTPCPAALYAVGAGAAIGLRAFL